MRLMNSNKNKLNSEIIYNFNCNPNARLKVNLQLEVFENRTY